MRRRGRWAVVAGIAAAAIVALSGCIGTTDREDFNQIIQARSGGLTSDLPLDAVGAVADRLGVDDFALRTLTITPLEQTVVLEVRDPAVPENLDRYVTRDGAIDSVEPIRLAEADDLDLQTFPVSRVALDRIEPMVDAALAGFGRAGAYVTSVSVSQGGDETVVVQLALESPRATGTARFTADGDLIEVTQT